MHHANVSGQNTSCACVVVLHFAKLIVSFLFFYENVKLMSSFFHKFVIVLINW